LFSHQWKCSGYKSSDLRNYLHTHSEQNVHKGKSSSLLFFTGQLFFFCFTERANAQTSAATVHYGGHSTICQGARKPIALNVDAGLGPYTVVCPTGSAETRGTILTAVN
jgi:hypothetical protein